MTYLTAGTAENLLLQSFQPRAIQYVSQGKNGAIIVKMNTPANTAAAKQILRGAGYTVAGN